jgi:F-type H+-transporting ATPase subunit b
MELTVALSVLLSGGSMIDLDGTFFLQIGIFFVAFLVLRGLVFQPVMALFDARDAAIGGARQAARDMEQEAEDSRAKLEGELKSVRLAANAEREDARNAAQRSAREQTERARTAAEKLLADARTKLDQEGSQVRAEMNALVPVLANQIASKLLGREVR